MLWNFSKWQDVIGRFAVCSNCTLQILPWHSGCSIKIRCRKNSKLSKKLLVWNMYWVKTDFFFYLLVHHFFITLLLLISVCYTAVFYPSLNLLLIWKKMIKEFHFSIQVYIFVQIQSFQDAFFKVCCIWNCSMINSVITRFPCVFNGI